MVTDRNTQARESIYIIETKCWCMKEEKKRGINKTLDFKEQTAIVSRYKRTRTLQDNKHSTVGYVRHMIQPLGSKSARTRPFHIFTRFTRPTFRVKTRKSRPYQCNCEQKKDTFVKVPERLQKCVWNDNMDLLSKALAKTILNKRILTRWENLVLVSKVLKVGKWKHFVEK